jgi:hypothetical protein
MNQAVANTQQAGFKHARGDAAVTAHGIVAASAVRPLSRMMPFIREIGCFCGIPHKKAVFLINHFNTLG